MAALNPAYQNQSARPLPALFGYGYGSGDKFIDYEDPAGNLFAAYALFDGECDGPEPITFIDGAGGPGSTPTVSQNFHDGRWTPIGLSTAYVSKGPDQGFDSTFFDLPTVTPPQTLSGICYQAYEHAAPTGYFRGEGTTTYTLAPISPYSIYRGARVRYFDVNGNVIGYGFSTNPTWHIIEALLRWKFKVQQPQIAGLTNAEKALFDWPAIVAHAQRNDFVLANGAPRFMGNYVFANDGTLTSMLETMLRCCRSYIDDQDGKIGIFGHDSYAASFAASSNHFLPNTWKLSEKDITGSPNVFVPMFRDLDIPAVASVNTATSTNSGFTFGTSSLAAGPNYIIWNTGGISPFAANQLFTYGGSSVAELDGNYSAILNIDPTVIDPPIIGLGNSSFADFVANGGYIGATMARFQARAPITVQHRQHQRAVGQIAPGVNAPPNIVQVEYDLGNMTYEQAFRLMQYECNSTLGMDIPGWRPPLVGSASVRLDAVDASGNLFARMRPGEARGTFTVDDTVAPELCALSPTGLASFYITSMTMNSPSPTDPEGSIDINFKVCLPESVTVAGTTYYGFPDVCTSTDQSLQTVPNANLNYMGQSVSLPNIAWTIEATPAAASGSVTVPDLTLQVLGEVGFRTYPGAAWTGLPSSGPVYLYVDDPDPGTTTPTFGFSTAVPTGWPATRYPVYVGGISAVVA